MKIWYCAPNRQKVLEYKIPDLAEIIDFYGICKTQHRKIQLFSSGHVCTSNSALFNRTEEYEGASHDDETIKAGNVHTGTSEEDEQETETARIGPLTFDPTPQLEDDEQHHHVATDDQAELMRWHHRLGHLSFAKLKTIAQPPCKPRPGQSSSKP